MPEVDPCAKAEELRATRLAIISGKGEIEIQFDREKVRYSSANLGALDREIARLERECDVAQGKPRRRYAKRMRFGSF